MESLKDQQINNNNKKRNKKKICPLFKSWHELGVRICPSCPSSFSFFTCSHPPLPPTPPPHPRVCVLHICRVTGLSAAEIRHTHPRQVLISDFINRLPASLHASHGRLDFPPPQVIEFRQVQHHTKPTDREHEDQEHCLLRGSGDVALDVFYAGVAVTFVHRRNVESIQEILAHQKAYFQRVSEHHLDDVKPGDALLSPHFGLCSSHGRIRDLFDF